MEIQTSNPWNLEHALRQNLAVGHDDDDVRRKPANLRNHFVVSNPHRLKNRHRRGSRLRFDRRSLDLLVAPDGFVGLRDHANQLVLWRVQESTQGRPADFARADEDNPHAALRHQTVGRDSPTRTTRSGGPRHHFVAGSYFALADRRRATGTKIVVKLAVRQNEEETFAHRHRRFALLAVETGGREIFKLRLTHVPHSKPFRECGTRLWPATRSRPPIARGLDNVRAPAWTRPRKSRGGV